MLSLNSIKYGLVPYGPAIGKRALFIDYSSNSLEYDENVAEADFDEFKNYLTHHDLKEAYLSAINGSHSTFLIFKGGDIEKAENQQEWDYLYSKITKESIEVQKTLRLAPDKLKPPFCIWAGTPKVFSSQRQFYQYFNCIYAILTFNDYFEDKTDYSPLALQECLNHQFSILALKVQTDEEYLTDLEKLAKEFNLTNKVNLIEFQTGEESYVRDYALQKDYRYYVCKYLDKFLQF